MEQLIKWLPETRRLDQLTPLENNPFGKITTEKRRRLEQKLLELGTFEAATIDENGVLLTFNKRHNLLLGLYGPQHVVNVLVPAGPLPDDVRRKIIIASNVNEGDWIDEILRDQYDDLLAEMGLSLAAGDNLVADAGAAGALEQPEYPIVAEFSEKYSAVVIVCKNDIDFNFVQQVLGLEKQQSYKAKEVGTTRVIDAAAFSEQWKSR